jgi:hypothetical protein
MQEFWDTSTHRLRKPNTVTARGEGITKVPKKSSTASILPLILAALAIVSSVGIYILTRTTAHAFVLHLIGYLLTPLAVALCLGWDSISQRVKRGNDPWFSANPTFSVILRILTVASFVISFPHIVAMASDIAEKLSGQK